MKYRGIEINEDDSKYIGYLEKFLSLSNEERFKELAELGKARLVEARKALLDDSASVGEAMKKYNFIINYLDMYRKGQNA